MAWVTLAMGTILLGGARFLLWVDGFVLQGVDWFIQGHKRLIPESLNEEEAEAI